MHFPRSFGLLAILQELRLSLLVPSSSQEYERVVDKTRFDRAEKNASNETRIQRRHDLDIFSNTSSLYGPGIDDSV